MMYHLAHQTVLTVKDRMEIVVTVVTRDMDYSMTEVIQ